ncbi:hypothetical protein Hanom_Chr07g00632211 [Helianthus anomalus]
MLLMVGSRLRVYQDEVNKNNDELIQIRLADSIHYVHEDSRGISQTKWHDCELIMPITSTELSWEYLFHAHGVDDIQIADQSSKNKKRLAIDQRDHQCEVGDIDS